MTAISIKSMLDAHVAANGKVWEHDRTLTVGASEVGQCLRKTWFAKNGIKPGTVLATDRGSLAVSVRAK